MNELKLAVSAEEFKAACEPWLAGKQTARATMAKLGVKPNTFYRQAKELGIEPPHCVDTLDSQNVGGWAPIVLVGAACQGTGAEPEYRLTSALYSEQLDKRYNKINGC